ncbi:hypothetical protein LCGC14_0571230 [marine sediment metagenome]|uniref:Uncharacterized protein n=1 Tax=marine sediment metagenome TaxID=412755 RepID=A0A0F9RJ61_9ZZZZ
MEEKKTIKERIAELEEVRKELKKLEKKKKFKIPFKARVSKRRMSQGYMTVIVINDNKNLDFIREPITDGTFKCGDTIHSLSEKDIFFYKNKPFVFQPKRSLNPYNPLQKEHETYGQKLVMARMEGDKITLKKSIGWGMSVGIIVIIGIIAYSVITGA